jgi:hypothetical protein
VQPDVGHVAGHLVEHRPRARGVGHDHPDAVRAQELAELGRAEGRVPHLEHVAQRAVDRCRCVGRLLELGGVVVGSGVRRRVRRGAGQEVEERGEPVGVEPEVRRELPQQRAEAVAERQHAARQEGAERGLHVDQLLHVGDEPRALHGEDEVVGHLRGPRPPARRALEGVEGPVDLDRRQPLAHVCELAAVRQAGRVEHAAPAGVPPAGDPDPRHAGSSRTSGCTCGVPAPSTVMPGARRRGAAH